VVELPTALIVDDALPMRTMLKRILERDGHIVVGEAENGQMAVDLYLKLKPDFVTMDITMAVMDGIEAVKRIKESDPQAKILMCSAIGQQSLIVQAIEYGAKDFITKPFLEERVIESIRNMFHT
jgi:two-component system chemotaxis response regulator CheY